MQKLESIDISTSQFDPSIGTDIEFIAKKIGIFLLNFYESPALFKALRKRCK
jgi:hypothetical protein